MCRLEPLFRESSLKHRQTEKDGPSTTTVGIISSPTPTPPSLPSSPSDHPCKLFPYQRSAHPPNSPSSKRHPTTTTTHSCPLVCRKTEKKETIIIICCRCGKSDPKIRQQTSQAHWRCVHLQLGHVEWVWMQRMPSMHRRMVLVPFRYLLLSSDPLDFRRALDLCLQRQLLRSSKLENEEIHFFFIFGWVWSLQGQPLCFRLEVKNSMTLPQVDQGQGVSLRYMFGGMSSGLTFL